MATHEPHPQGSDGSDSDRDRAFEEIVEQLRQRDLADKLDEEETRITGGLQNSHWSAASSRAAEIGVLEGVDIDPDDPEQVALLLAAARRKGRPAEPLPMVPPGLTHPHPVPGAPILLADYVDRAQADGVGIEDALDPPLRYDYLPQGLGLVAGMMRAGTEHEIMVRHLVRQLQRLDPDDWAVSTHSMAYWVPIPMLVVGPTGIYCVFVSHAGEEQVAAATSTAQHAARSIELELPDARPVLPVVWLRSREGTAEFHQHGRFDHEGTWLLRGVNLANWVSERETAWPLPHGIGRLMRASSRPLWLKLERPDQQRDQSP